MGFWICFNCGSHNVYEKMYVRLNRLACIIDDIEDLMERIIPLDIVRIATIRLGLLSLIKVCIGKFKIQNSVF